MQVCALEVAPPQNGPQHEEQVPSGFDVNYTIDDEPNHSRSQLESLSWRSNAGQAALKYGRHKDRDGIEESSSQCHWQPGQQSGWQSVNFRAAVGKSQPLVNLSLLLLWWYSHCHHAGCHSASNVTILVMIPWIRRSAVQRPTRQFRSCTTTCQKAQEAYNQVCVKKEQLCTSLWMCP